MAKHDIVFLVDVDNTLLDNDRVAADLMRHLVAEVGRERQQRYWALFEELRTQLGYADYLGALQRYRVENPRDPHLLTVSLYLAEYPFANRLYPNSLDAIDHLKRWGPVVILSDGDAVFQPRKIERSGLYDAVDRNVLIYIHKEQELEDVERDAHGNVRIAEVNIGEILKAQVQARLKQFGVKTTIVAKNIGYELRCADPVPFDMEYTRDLGYCATKYLLSGGNAAMISMQGGHFVPVPFAKLVDPTTGRTRVRLVDITSARYAIARRYMIRLRRDDFEDPPALAKFAATAGLTLEEFRAQFEYLVESEPPPFNIEPLGAPG